MKKKLFIKNAAILTLTALILRFGGIVFKVWLAAKIGSEGIGLYQLVFSVYALVSTFAVCGISTAVTRLCADELALGSSGTVRRIIRRSVSLSLIIAFLSAFAVYFGAAPIAGYFIGDMRAVKSLKILSFGLPFMGLSSCIKGYFIARRRTLPPSISQILEQAVRIAVCVVTLTLFSDGSIESSAAAVLFGDTVAEGASCLYTYIAYLYDRKKMKTLNGRRFIPYPLTRRIAVIALPIAGGRYLNSALRTAENMLVPKSLVRFGMTNSVALSVFGNVKGMTLPVLLFPSSLLSAISLLLIPEMSEFSAKGDDAGIKRTVKKALSLTFTFSAVFCAIFLIFGQNIGEIIYSEREVGRQIKILAPLIPVMYIDSVADGLLKGLDEQLVTFRNSILDSALRIILVMLFVPRFGFYAFIGIMYFSNLFTAFLNVARLVKRTKAFPDIVDGILIPSLAAAISGLFSAFAVRIIANVTVKTAVFCALSLMLYAVLLFVSRINEVKKEYDRTSAHSRGLTAYGKIAAAVIASDACRGNRKN